jgi:hypothetical protein
MRNLLTFSDGKECAWCRAGQEFIDITERSSRSGANCFAEVLSPRALGRKICRTGARRPGLHDLQKRARAAAAWGSEMGGKTLLARLA